MPRILGRHEMFPRLNNKPWLNSASGSSWASSGSTFSSSSSSSSTHSNTSLRKSTTSVNLSERAHSAADRNEASSKREGMTYRIDQGYHEGPTSTATPAAADDWGFYVDFVEPADTEKHHHPRQSFFPDKPDEEILCLETAMMEWALSNSSGRE